MASSFCPKCGTPRVGALRFCPSCKLDLNEIDRAAGADSTTQAPESNAPAPPPSYSEKYAGTQWAATPLATASVEPGSRRSPGGMIAIVGLVGVAVVAGLVVVFAAGGFGRSPAAPAATTAVTTATASPTKEKPTASPTTDPMDAAASRFRVIEDAYLKAYNERHDTLPATGYFASYAQARSYYRAEVRNLQRFGTHVREITFPAVVMPDVTVLLQRISEEATLMEELAATAGETAGWKINEKIMTARTVMNAARVVVGGNLGLAYAPTPRPTARPTARPTPRPTPKPATASGTTAADYRRSVSQTYEVDLAKAVAGLRSVSSCTTEEECYYAGQEQRTYIRLATGVLKAHLADMKANPCRELLPGRLHEGPEPREVVARVPPDLEREQPGEHAVLHADARHLCVRDERLPLGVQRLLPRL